MLLSLRHLWKEPSIQEKDQQEKTRVSILSRRSWCTKWVRCRHLLRHQGWNKKMSKNPKLWISRPSRQEQTQTSSRGIFRISRSQVEEKSQRCVSLWDLLSCKMISTWGKRLQQLRKRVALISRFSLHRLRRPVERHGIDRCRMVQKTLKVHLFSERKEITQTMNGNDLSVSLLLQMKTSD